MFEHICLYNIFILYYFFFNNSLTHDLVYVNKFLQTIPTYLGHVQLFTIQIEQ